MTTPQPRTVVRAVSLWVMLAHKCQPLDVKKDMIYALIDDSTRVDTEGVHDEIIDEPGDGDASERHPVTPEDEPVRYADATSHRILLVAGGFIHS